jgi:23S rRNA pseudouridine2605 synthase
MKRNNSQKLSTDSKKEAEDKIRLNKYIGNSGICSRREADTLIAEGKVKVNGKVVTEMGYKVDRKDNILVDGKEIKPVKNVYILLNKPKGYLSTTKDPEDRKTVMELIKNATKERIYPVGRLDRNTTGLLLLTNDGELTNELIHPSRNFSKIYSVKLERNFAREDAEKLLTGIELEDGLAQVDEVAFINERDKSEVGVKIHSGKNRVIRRLFSALGYEVEKLDRVMFGMLTKRDLPRGKWRFLTDKEVRSLKGQR